MHAVEQEETEKIEGKIEKRPKVLNIFKNEASDIIASGKRPDGFLVFPAGHTPEVKGWLVWLLGGGHCNGVRPFIFVKYAFTLEKGDFLA